MQSCMRAGLEGDESSIGLERSGAWSVRLLLLIKVQRRHSPMLAHDHVVPKKLL